MPEVISDIVVSAAKLFHSPVGTALPLDTLDVDAAWPVGWVSVGYTLEPVKAQYTFDVLEVMVQQEMGTVKRIRIKEALKLATILAELTATNMALSFAGEVTTAAATSHAGRLRGVLGRWQVRAADGAVGHRGLVRRRRRGAAPIRVFVWKATRPPAASWRSTASRSPASRWKSRAARPHQGQGPAPAGRPPCARRPNRLIDAGRSGGFQTSPAPIASKQGALFMAYNGREVPSHFPQVTLGGQKYDIRPLPILQARTWRQAVKEPLQLIISTVANLPDLSLQDLELHLDRRPRAAPVHARSPMRLT